ncbi:Hypothetical protein BN2458_PEG0090 [Helicobacter typhlonius]|uniref:Uncharacterized protein n=1 Tax=Helicobacter typhlonius TaxID=76936 RepID=A0A0S4PSD6_9HELI|nr:Hypothetical protein BN2458_PEG0090 [Helicobacter typhlonius]
MGDSIQILFDIFMFCFIWSFVPPMQSRKKRTYPLSRCFGN